MGTRKDKKTQARLERRKHAWWLRTTKFLTESQIAERLGVHTATVCRDLSATATERNEEVQQLRLKYLQIHTAQLATVMVEAFEAWHRSKEPLRVVTKTMGANNEPGRTTITHTERDGDPAHLKEILAALKQQASLLGLSDETLKIELMGAMAHQHHHQILPTDPEQQRRYIEELAGAALLLHGGDAPIDVSLPSEEDHHG